MTGKAPQQTAEAQRLYRSGVEALSAGRFREGLALLEKVAAMAPPNAEIHNNLGTAHWKCGNLKEAEAQYARALRLAPDSVPALYNAGALLVGQMRLEEAEKHLSRALKLQPQHAAVLNQLGVIGCWRGDLSGAEKFFTQAIAARPGWAEPYNNLGNAQALDRQPERAEKSYRKALEIDPNYAPAWCDIGRLFVAEGRNKDAEDAFRTAMRLQPDSERAWVSLLDLLELTNRDAEAEEILKQAKQRFPASPSLAACTARLLRRKGDVNAAIAELEKISPESAGTAAAGICFELGQLYDQAKQADKAFAAFRRAKAAQASQPDAKIVDKTVHTKTAARLMKELDAALAKALPEAPPEERASPAFMVGFPRSGTTLLDQILSSHPGVYVAEEIPGVDAMGEYFRRKYGTTAKPGENPRTGAEIWADPCYPAALAKLQPGDIAEMRRIFFRRHGADDAARGKLFIDRMPVNLMHGALIHTVFPKAKFILALRHPCDCVLSSFMTAFRMNPATARFLDLKDAAKFYDEMFGVWEQTRRILPLAVHPIRYEDVVADFRPAIESLLSFLGLPWNDAVLDFDKTAKAKERINTASYAQVTQKIYTRASLRWLRYEKHLEPVIDLLNPHAARYGYSMKNPD